MSIFGKASAADSESARSLKSPLLTSDACPDSKLEIEQSDGAALQAPQAGSQSREGCQRPGDLPKGGVWEICIRDEESKIQQHPGVDLRWRSVVSIFRVPSFQVSRKSYAYIPQIVSLGPYHQGRPELDPMEIHKARAVNRMVRRSKKEDFFRTALDTIWKDRDDIMKSYEGKYECNDPKNIAMMVRDGCFILEILRTLSGDKHPPATLSGDKFPLTTLSGDKLPPKFPLTTLSGDKLPPTNVSNCYEPIFVKHNIDYTGFDILNDMLKLENQIPFSVLEMLLKLEGNDTVASFFQKFFSEVIVNSPIGKNAFYPFYDKTATEFPWRHEDFLRLLREEKDTHEDFLRLLREEKVTHLLGLWHGLIAPPPPDCNGSQRNDDMDSDRNDDIHKVYANIRGCAVDLKKAGIKFEKTKYGEIESEQDEKSKICLPPIFGKVRYDNKEDENRKIYLPPIFRKIRYDNSTIYLPPITITDHTEVLFRNLMAHELCKRFETNYLNCYVDLMDTLINSGEDVAVLTRSGVITHSLGRDEEVARFFNGLCRGITLSNRDKMVFDKLRADVEDAYNNKKRVQFVEFVNENFASPWKALAVAGAVIGLVLTLVTTIFTILSVVK